MRMASIDDGNRIQLPAEWTAELRLHAMAALEKTADGILIRPCSPATWDELFEAKLTVRPTDPDQEPVQVDDDDVLF
jgi:DNA-binding transcriptional regulator/RsmH inhibitor MraZ